MENKSYEIKGLKELQDAIRQLPAKLQAKLISGFLKKAGKKHITDGLKQKLSYSSKLESSIKVVGDRDPLKVHAGVTGPGYKLRWLDLGTSPRYTKKGWFRGSINPKNQIQPYIESKIEDVVKYINDEMSNEINKALERRLKKLKRIS